MDTLFRSQMEDYSNFHRDKRNKITHYLGIPAIVLSITYFLRGFVFDLGSLHLDAAMIALILLGVFYLALNRVIGLGMVFFLAAMYLAAPYLSVLFAWILFIGGWILQFIGHFFEGRKPAFFRNAIHLLVGPMWILNDLFLQLGLPGYRSGNN